VITTRPNKRNGKTVTRTPRKCMCCRNTFMSEGPHNRLCKNCRHESTKLAALEAVCGDGCSLAGRRSK
jgi:hypothetical protein